MRTRLFLAVACLLATSVSAGAQQTERFSRKAKLGADGRITVTNVAGEIVVAAGSGDDVSIEAIKRTSGDRSELANVRIDVSERPGRVDVTTSYPIRFFNNPVDHVSVDYTVTVPASASVELRSISGTVRVTGVKGTVRAQTVSGEVTISGTPKLEQAKSVSGSVELTDIASDDSLTAGTISGRLRASRLTARSVDMSTISGRLELTDIAASDRFSVRTISGTIDLTGTLATNGRYDINSHSGAVRLALPAATGFELDANTFSGSIRSEFAMTVGGDINRDIRGRGRGSRGSIHATVGNGAAQLAIRTFSGDVTITKH